MPCVIFALRIKARQIIFINPRIFFGYFLYNPTVKCLVYRIIVFIIDLKNVITKFGVYSEIFSILLPDSRGTTCMSLFWIGFSHPVPHSRDIDKALFNIFLSLKHCSCPERQDFYLKQD